MAQALIIDDDFGKLAHSYYGLIPNEPIDASTSLTIDARTTIPHTSFKTLLSTIIDKASSNADLVIVAHGNDNGMIMKLNVDARHSVAAITARLNTLTGTETAADKAKSLNITEDMIKELLALISDVQKLQLNHVAFRGCTIGKSTSNLDTLRDVLGAKSVSGTDVFSTFGSSRPTFEKKAGEFEQWKTSFGKNSYIWDDRVIFFSVDKPHFTTKIGIFARSKNDIAGWLKAMFLASRKDVFEHFMEVLVPVHYLDFLTTPILPRDGEYTAHIFKSS